MFKAYTAYANINKFSDIFEEGNNLVKSKLDSNIMTPMAWSLAKYAKGLIYYDPPSYNELLQNIMNSKLFSGGIDLFFTKDFTDKTKKTLKILNERHEIEEVQNNIIKNDSMLAIIHKDT
jgi:hypothetical protein